MEFSEIIIVVLFNSATSGQSIGDGTHILGDWTELPPKQDEALSPFSPSIILSDVPCIKIITAESVMPTTTDLCVVIFYTLKTEH